MNNILNTDCDSHCHDKKDNCIKAIEDCYDHFLICADDCHQECACKNP